MYYDTTLQTMHATVADFRAAHPLTSYGPLTAQTDREAVGLFELAQVPPAHDAALQTLAMTGAAQVDGHWHATYAVQDKLLSVEELANIDKARADARWQRIKALRDGKTQTGGYRVGDKWFHSDTFSRTQQMALVMMGAAMPTGLQWKTLDGSFVAMTPTLAQQIFAAAALQDAALFAHAEALRADSTADVLAGWPATFGGTP